MTDNTPRQRKSEQTKAELLAAFKDSFESKGYHGSNMRDVVKSVGLTTGAFFANWKSKEDIYVEIYGHKPVTPEQGRKLMDWVGTIILHYDTSPHMVEHGLSLIGAIKGES